MSSTSAKCGYNGTISLGGEVTKWEFIEELDTPDATSMTSGGFHEYISCLKSASGSFETQTAMGAVGSHAGVTFEDDVVSYTLDLIVTDIKNAVPVGDKITFTYSFISTGAIVVTPK